MGSTGWRVVVATVAVVWAGVASGKIIYVDDDANSPGDGTTWATAYKYLQDALADARATPGGGNGRGDPRLVEGDGASEAGIEIRVARGVYRPDRSASEPNGTRDRLASLELVSGVALLGGYAGLGAAVPNARDSRLYETILSGDLAGNDVPVADPCDLRNEPTRAENSCSIVKIMHASGVRLEGFSVGGGFADMLGPPETPPATVGAGVHARESEQVEVADCLCIGNYALSGAAVVVAQCTGASVSRSRLIGNYRGLTVNNSICEIRDCEIRGNYTDGVGGGATLDGVITMRDCVLVGNAANTGGGAFLREGTVDISRCDISRNSAKNGAGVTAGTDGTHSLRDCTFSNNSAAQYGGAMIVGSISAHIAGCMFAGNSSGAGGTVWGVRFDEMHITNCTFVGNRASRGRTLLCESVKPKSVGEVYALNSIVANGGYEIATDDSKVFIDYCLLTEDADSIADPNGNVTLGAGVIVSDPCFAEPGHWDSSGEWFAIGDYHLRSQGGRWDSVNQIWVSDTATSPCVDAGDPAAPVGYEPFPNGGRINIGAYGGTTEASKSYFGGLVCETIVAGDVNGDCRVDFQDFQVLALHWLEDRR